MVQQKENILEVKNTFIIIYKWNMKKEDFNEIHRAIDH